MRHVAQWSLRGVTVHGTHRPEIQNPLAHARHAVRPANTTLNATAFPPCFSNHHRPIMTLSLSSPPSSPSSPLALAGDIVPDTANPFDFAASFEVRVWNEDEFRHESSVHTTGVHVVLSSPQASNMPAMDAQTLRANLASGTVRLLLLARNHTLALEAPHAVVPPSFRGGLPPGALRRVRDFVTRRLAEKIELSQLADIAGLSVCHFSRAFKQSMGLPPHRYLMRERVAAAARLIRATDRPLVEISLEVGFSDQSHFTRCFSDVMGDTPRDYRRKHR